MLSRCRVKGWGPWRAGWVPGIAPRRLARAGPAGVMPCAPWSWKAMLSHHGGSFQNKAPSHLTLLQPDHPGCLFAGSSGPQLRGRTGWGSSPCAGPWAPAAAPTPMDLPLWCGCGEGVTGLTETPPHHELTLIETHPEAGPSSLRVATRITFTTVLCWWSRHYPPLLKLRKPRQEVVELGPRP